MAEHKHTKDCDHGHHHYTPSNEPLDMNELDAGNKALANALRVSFGLLKLIMVVLVIAYFASGIYTIEPDWQGLVLRMGKITGKGTERVKQPGLGWCWPQPIDEIVKLPVRKQQTIEMSSQFWYSRNLNPERPKPTLSPEIDGYILTRNEPVAGISSGSDYNLLHSKWEIKYHIGDIELFFKNMFIDELGTGQDFYDVKGKSLEPALENFASEAIVTTMLHYSIDQALTVSKKDIAEDVKRSLAGKLQSINSGLVIDSVLLTSITWPPQVNEAFLASTKAKLDSDTEEINAEKYANEIINQAGGRNARTIAENLEEPQISDDDMQVLWDNIAGEAKDVITTAQAYRTRTIESARANAIYLEKLLPEYQKRPRLVLQQLYQDAVEEVLENADEKIFIHPKDENNPREIRLMVSRDATIKKDKKSDQQ